MPRRRLRIAPFHHPDATQVDYDQLLDALRHCREQVDAFRVQTGTRNPAYEAAEELLARIEALAALTRQPDALRRLGPPASLPSGPPKPPRDD